MKDPVKGAMPEARWQQAAVTLVALYPAVLLVDSVLGPRLHTLPRPLAVLASIVPVVLAMTYVLVPLVARLAAALAGNGRVAVRR